MRKLMIAAALAATPALGLAADLSMDTKLGASMDEVRASLVEMGYEVRKMETEDGDIEAYVVKGDRMGEVYVDARSGKVRKIEMK